MILFAPLASFASETRWELSREGSRSVTTRSENGNRLSVAFDFDGNRQPHATAFLMLGKPADRRQLSASTPLRGAAPASTRHDTRSGW